MHLACAWGHIDIAKLLIENNADITKKDNDGKTPLDELNREDSNGYRELMEWITEYHPEKMLELMASENIQGKGVGL